VKAKQASNTGSSEGVATRGGGLISSGPLTKDLNRITVHGKGEGTERGRPGGEAHSEALHSSTHHQRGEKGGERGLFQTKSLSKP